MTPQTLRQPPTAAGHDAPTPPLEVAPRLRVVSVHGDEVRLALPGTDYVLHLKFDPARPGATALRSGARVRGRIEGGALRLHHAAAGGRFIEPVDGAPRIVQGSIVAVDSASGRVCVDCGVPIWVEPTAGCDPGAFAEGGLVNFYLASGTRFVVTEG